jgi:hypothetical protein
MVWLVKTSAVLSKKRFSWLCTWPQIEQLLVFVGLAVYAILASLSQKPRLLVLMLTVLIVGNLLAIARWFNRRSAQHPAA